MNRAQKYNILSIKNQTRENIYMVIMNNNCYILGEQIIISSDMWVRMRLTTGLLLLAMRENKTIWMHPLAGKD